MSEDLEHELLDRDLRPFVEECDQMQGFQVITGADDAWAGFASKYLEGLRDEFGRKSVWVWGLEEARQGGRVSVLDLKTSTKITADHIETRRRNAYSSSLTPHGLFRLSLLKPRFIFLSPIFLLAPHPRTSTCPQTPLGIPLPSKPQPSRV